ncbi:MAG TPA: transposase, partial [Actinoplanes sp.]|nr:transposase [Actinoplanes sp.]
MPVQLAGVGKQVEQVGQRLGGRVDVRGSGVVELPGEPGPFVADQPQPGGDLLLRPVCFADEIQEAIFLRAELREFGGHPSAERGALVGRAEQGFVHPIGDLVAQFTRQRDRRVVVQDGRLHSLDRMRRLADLHPGTAKTDARDAYVIADAARTLPHTLRRVDAGDEMLAELEVLIGYDDDLAAESTRVSNRIRGLLTQIHPALEHVLGPKISHPAVQELLSKCGGPTGLRKAGRRKLLALVASRAPRMGTRLVEAVLTALDEQTVTVP